MKTNADNKPLPHRLTVFLQWCVVLIGFSVPISVVFDNMMLALILLGALFRLRNIAHIVRDHPVARAALLLFSMLAIAMSYGPTPLKEALIILVKYVDLAFIPIFIFLLSDPTLQRRARRAFLAAMAITLVGSYLIGSGLLPIMPWMHLWTVPENPAIFHSHITQNNMMAFAIFLALLEMRAATTRISRIFWSAFALIASINVLFMVQGRTGYLILLSLSGWFLWTSLARHFHKHGKRWGWHAAALASVVLFASAFIAYHSSSRLHDRIALVISEYQAWTPNNENITSTGDRLNFYFNSLQIVGNHMSLGVGTGGFPAAFEQQTQNSNVTKTRNPHNEYLMISVQTGLIGLALMLYLFYTHWRYAPMLESPFEQDAARGLLLAYTINCMLNSALMDHADGLFFAFMTAVLFANLKTGTKNDQ